MRADLTDQHLKEAGWTVGSRKELLDLTNEEDEYVKLKLELAIALRGARRDRKLSQLRFAQLIGSSQSRVAKMEAGDPSVTLDLLMKALFALGMTRADIAKTIHAC